MIVFTTDDLISVAVWVGAAILFGVLWALDSFIGKGKNR